MQIWIETTSSTLLEELNKDKPKGVRFTRMLIGTHTESELDTMTEETFVIKVNIDSGACFLRPVIAHILAQQQRTTDANFIEIGSKRLPLESPEMVNSVVEAIIQEGKD